MTNGDEYVCKQVRHYLSENGVLYAESEIQNATKFEVKSGSTKCSVLVYNSGKIVVQGADSELKEWCNGVKESIEQGTGAPGILLPPEIEKLPATLQERVPACDGVVVWFYQEALRCYKAGSAAGAAFMLGAASEKAILVLIDTYASQIRDETKRDRFRSRTNNRMISVKYDEFKRSYKSASPRPKELPLSQDIEQLLDGAFNFYRHTRNQVGHPQIIPDLDKGIILANIGQFITYVERIYGLIDFFEQNGVVI